MINSRSGSSLNSRNMRGDTMETPSRERFSSTTAVFLASLGSALGLGNIWKFPYMTGKFGGGAFLMLYVISVLLVAVPAMVSEFVIGRRARRNAVQSFEVLAPHSCWPCVGILAVAGSCLIMFFYASVAGWVYAYIGKSLIGSFTGVTVEGATQQFNSMVSSPFVPIIWLFVVVFVISVVLIKGVQRGIEKITKTLIPIFFVLILICVARALTLSGAGEGLSFLYKVDFSLITPTVMLSAFGLAFFKMSVGMGTMITYSSYYTGSDRLIPTAIRIAFADILASLLAGMAIFPAVFSFGLEPQGGSGLLFITIPLVFSKIPFGHVLLPVFFVLCAIIATTAMISLVQVPVAWAEERFGLKKWKAVVINTGLIFSVGILSALSATPDGVLSEVKIMGLGFFDLFDFVSSNIALPTCALLTVLFVGWKLSKEIYFSEVTNEGLLHDRIRPMIFLFLIRFVAPVCILLVFLNSLGVI